MPWNHLFIIYHLTCLRDNCEEAKLHLRLLPLQLGVSFLCQPEINIHILHHWKILSTHSLSNSRPPPSSANNTWVVPVNCLLPQENAFISDFWNTALRRYVGIHRDGWSMWRTSVFLPVRILNRLTVTTWSVLFFFFKYLEWLLFWDSGSSKGWAPLQTSQIRLFSCSIFLRIFHLTTVSIHCDLESNPNV